LMGHVVPVG